MTALKWLFRIFFLFLVLIAALVFYLVVIFDLDELKPEIENIVFKNVGLNLHLDGDIDWQLYPTLGFAAKNVTVNDYDDKQLLVKADKAAFSVAFMPLLKKQIQANTLYFNGLQLNYHVDAKGKSGFDKSFNAVEKQVVTDESATKQVKDAEVIEGSSESIFVSSYPDIKVFNSGVSYKDAKSGSVYELNIDTLRTQPVSLSKPFNIVAGFVVKDNQGLDIAADIVSDVDISNKDNVIKFLNIDTTLQTSLFAPNANGADNASVKKEAIDINASALVFDQANDHLTLRDVIVSALGVDVSAEVKVSALSNTPQFEGAVNVQEFDLRGLLSTMGQTVETADSMVLGATSFKADLVGSEKYIQLKNIKATLDDTAITGGFKTQLSKKSSAHWFDISFDSINLDSYLPPRSETQVSSQSKQAEYSDDTILPIELLRSLLLQGRLKGSSMQLLEQKYTDIACDVRAAKGSVHLKGCGMNALDGRVNADISIDAYSDVPKVKISTDASKLSVGGIVELITNSSPLQGILNTDINIVLTGNTVESWLDSANGKVNVNIIDALLEGLNLRNVIANNIGEEVTQLIELGLAQKNWNIPSSLDKDTVFKDISAPVRLEDGVILVDNIKANLKSGDALSGNGKFDLLTQEFDYRLKLKTPNLTDEKHLKNIDWPIRCNGVLSGNPTSWCHLDKQGVKDIVTNLAKEKAEGRLRDLAAEKLGIQLDKDKSLADAAKAEAQKRAQEKISEEKRKAEEKVQQELKKKLGDAAGEEVTKQLGNVLDGLFGK